MTKEPVNIGMAVPLRGLLTGSDDPKSFANIGTKFVGVQGFTALLHQLPLWC